jgi:hypothetical protein
MRHAEALIERILFLDATPNVKQQIESDLALEIGAVAMYNRAAYASGQREQIVSGGAANAGRRRVSTRREPAQKPAAASIGCPTTTSF